MKRYRITKYNRKVLDKLCKSLPFDLKWRALETDSNFKKWLYNLWQKIAPLKWPNGEPVIGGSIVFFVCRKIFGMKFDLKTYNNKIINSYEKGGARQLIEYLLSLGIKHKEISHFIMMLKLTEEQNEKIRDLESRTGFKFLR